MLIEVHPKLPMRNKAETELYFTQMLGFSVLGGADYAEYLMVRLDAVELHFFLYPSMDITLNDGQAYIRVKGIHDLYERWIAEGVGIHPNGSLTLKPWGQWEFALLDPNYNLLTFGESVGR